MNYLPWIELLGRSSDDKQVRKLLKEAGVNEVPPMAKDEVTVNVRLENGALRFTDESQFPERDDLDDGMSVLTSVVLPLHKSHGGVYTGPLPFGIERTDSQEDLRRRLGKPIEEDDDDDLPSDVFAVGKLQVGAGYVNGRAAIGGLTIMLPEED